ncbi:MAG: hypothetical protein WC736_10040 [Gallionella sp.]
MALSAGAQAKTGTKCPQGGIWHPLNKPKETRSIGINNVMPPNSEGGSQIWVLKIPTGG